MDHIIEKIYWGDLHPCEQYVTSHREQAKLMSRLTNLEEDLRPALSEDALKLFHRYQECVSEIQANAEEDRFIAGFKLGVKLMTEVFGSSHK